MLIVELAIPFTRLVRAKNMVDSTAFSNLSGGQFTPESGGQFDPKWGGQFRPEQVVSLNRIEVVSFTEFSTQLRLYLELTEKGYKIAKQGLTSIGDIKRGEFRLHKNRFDSLSIVKPAIKKDPLASATVGHIRAMIILYWGFDDLMAECKFLSADEKKLVRNVFDRLASEAVSVLENLEEVTTSGRLKMTDDARTSQIASLFEQSQSIHTFARQLTSEPAMLSAQRKQEFEALEYRRFIHGITY
jgi:hypothetical protein